MGALVLTPGTIALCKLFSTEFKDSIDVYRTGIKETDKQNIIDEFYPGNKNDLLDISDHVVKQHNGDSGRSDHKCLLPYDKGLEKRWRLFLKGYLDAGNHKAIKEKIYEGLNDASCEYIQFDCVDGSGPMGSIQTVLFAYEYEYDQDGNPTIKYLKIVLVTPPMPQATMSPADDDSE
jgi:hypothetical protein